MYPKLYPLSNHKSTLHSFYRVAFYEHLLYYIHIVFYITIIYYIFTYVLVYYQDLEALKTVVFIFGKEDENYELSIK